MACGPLFLAPLSRPDDERCLAILRTCKRAMHADARLLVVERIASVSVGANPHDQLVARADLNMMIANGGRERTETEYRRLLVELAFDKQDKI